MSSSLLAHTLPKVLVVDDEPAMRSFLCQALSPLAAKVVEAGDATSALAAIENGDFDVVLSDWYMPGTNGLELLALAHQSQWDVGFILITGRPHVDQIIAALRMGLSDFLVKPLQLQELAQAVGRAYRKVLVDRESRNYRRMLETGLERRTRDLETALRRVETNYQTTLEALVAALDAREHETYAHSFRVRAYTSHLASLVGYPPALLIYLEQAALLHDIGKISVSDAILLKPGKLTESEWKEMKKHPVAGQRILQRISFLKPSAKIVRHHHERIDGTGYPDGLAGEQIPLGARLFALADTLDAITSNRLYRKAQDFTAAREEICRCAGSQFDPEIAVVFCQVPEETWKELGAHAEKLCGQLEH